jgi:hypothetical protein
LTEFCFCFRNQPTSQPSNSDSMWWQYSCRNRRPGQKANPDESLSTILQRMQTSSFIFVPLNLSVFLSLINSLSFLKGFNVAQAILTHSSNKLESGA